jgi:hypothetical protein
LFKSIKLSVRLRKLQLPSRRAGSIAAFVAALSICCSLPLAPAQAGTTTPFSPIAQIGCDTSGDTICFVSISPSAGPAGCNTTSIRFDPNAMLNGGVALSMLTQAFMTGKAVSFYISDTCFPEDPRYATFDYYLIGGG